jgi:hypothetical protein
MFAMSAWDVSPERCRCVASFPSCLQTHSAMSNAVRFGATLNGWKWRHRGNWSGRRVIAALVHPQGLLHF